MEICCNQLEKPNPVRHVVTFWDERFSIPLLFELEMWSYLIAGEKQILWLLLFWVRLSRTKRNRNTGTSNSIALIQAHKGCLIKVGNTPSNN